MTFNEADFVAADLQVQVSELLIATPDTSDPMVDSAVHQVLKLLREQHQIEAAFLGEVVDGRRICRDAAIAGSAQLIAEDVDSLELAFCKQALNVGVSFGCFLSAPVVLNNGTVYGNLYAFSFSSDEGAQQRELKKLELSSQLAARLIDSRTPRAEPGRAQSRPVPAVAA
ncbi:conserved hypothetical protein [Burkholderiales bacterium 8X]|nr:conserved hypothetical protein [Burkholderiales bacterium 8X]